MLRHEYQVEHDTDKSQAELRRVTSYTRKVCLQGRINDKLEYRENAAGEIEQNLNYAPTDSRFALVVDPDLWNVLDDGHAKLEIPQGVDLLQTW